MTKNVYEDPLESFDYQEMLDSLAGIGVETGRLELKRQMIPRSKIAYIACSMANVDGGIIAIGIQEPTASTTFAVHGTVDTSDSFKAGLASAINGRIYPPIPFTIHGYQSGDQSQSFLVLRVSPSEIAPHEYIPSDDQYNLPIRRGSTTGQLRLAEINALQARQSGEPLKSPLGDQYVRRVILRKDSINPTLFFGIQLWPTIYQEHRRIMDVDDDRLCYQIATETRGTNGNLHEELSETTTTDGIWFHTRVWTQGDFSGGGAVPHPDQQLEIDSDGTITLRFKESAGDRWLQWFAALATGYVAAQEIYFAFGISPQTKAHVVHYLSAGSERSTFPFPQDYEDTFELNLATQPFSDAFLPTVMRMLRASNQNPRRASVRNDILQPLVASNLPIADDLQRRWLS